MEIFKKIGSIFETLFGSKKEKPVSMSRPEGMISNFKEGSSEPSEIIDIASTPGFHIDELSGTITTSSGTTTTNVTTTTNDPQYIPDYKSVLDKFGILVPGVNDKEDKKDQAVDSTPKKSIKKEVKKESSKPAKKRGRPKANLAPPKSAPSKSAPSKFKEKAPVKKSTKKNKDI